MDKDNAKWTLLVNRRLNTLYQTLNLKRSLINVIKSKQNAIWYYRCRKHNINKRVNEIATKQTADYIACHKKSPERDNRIYKKFRRNTSLQWKSNVMSRMQQQTPKAICEEDMDKHLLILNTIMTDLTNDEDIIDFMMYTKDGVISAHFYYR